MSALRWMIAILACAAALVVACGKGSGSEGSDFQRQRQALAPQAPAPAPTPKTTAEADEPSNERYAYDRLGKRDPFRSFILDRLKEDDANTKGPLEQFDLSQLSLLGVVWDTNRRRALVADPSGQGYIVSKGDSVGKNDGRVVDIDDNLVLVRERYVDYVGDQTTKEIEMRVRHGQGG